MCSHPGFRQLAATATLPPKLSRHRKPLQRVFLVRLGPSSRPRPGLQHSRKLALQKCILPRPPSPPPGLGSVPKVGAPLRGFLPYPRVRRPGTRRSQLTMVTPAAVAPPPGPAAWALELERDLLGELQKLVPFAKKTSSRHPSTHRSQWKPRWDSIQAGSETLGEARLGRPGAHSKLTMLRCLVMHPTRSAGLLVQLPCLDPLSPNT